MQCPCGRETTCQTIVRKRDDSGRWRVYDCDGCGRHEEHPLDEIARQTALADER
jgi:uncharacterized Zn finger protein